MANHKSALKRARQSAVRNQRNSSAKTFIKTLTKRVLTAVEEKSVEKATSAYQEAQKYLARMGRKGILHRNTAGRRVAQLAKLVGTLKSS